LRLAHGNAHLVLLLLITLLWLAAVGVESLAAAVVLVDFAQVLDFRLRLALLTPLPLVAAALVQQLGAQMA
jgi:hypothetical protein